MKPTTFYMFIKTIFYLMLIDTTMTAIFVGYYGYEELNPVSQFFLFMFGMTGFIIYHIISIVLVISLFVWGYIETHINKPTKVNIKFFNYISILAILLALSPLIYNTIQILK